MKNSPNSCEGTKEEMMIEGAGWSSIHSRCDNYKVVAKRLREKLSEQRLHGIRGQREYLLRRLQEAYSLSCEEAERQVAVWQTQILAAAHL